MQEQIEGVLSTEQIRSLGSKPVYRHAATNNLKLTCGHKLDKGRFPSVNCPDCWKVFFIVNKEMTKLNCKVIAEGREAEIAQTHGSKYLKQLKRFVAFVVEFAEKSKEQDGNI